MRHVDRVRSWAIRRWHVAGIRASASSLVKSDGKPNRTGTLGLIFILTFTSFDPAAIAAPQARQAQSMTNADVIREFQLGDSDAEIVASINRHKTAFVFNAAALNTLKERKLSALVQRAMFDSFLRDGAPTKAGQPPPSPAAPPAETNGNDGATPVVEPSLPSWCKNGKELAIDFKPGEAVNLTPVTAAPSDTKRAGIRLNANGSGAEIYTKSPVWIGYINRLRYRASLSGVVTPIAAPTIPAISFPAATAKTPVPPTNKLAADNFDSFNACFASIQDAVGNFQIALLRQENILNIARPAIMDRLETLQPVADSEEDVKRVAKTALGKSGGANANQSIFPANSIPHFPLAGVYQMKLRLDEFLGAYAAFSKTVNGKQDTFKKIQAAGTAFSAGLAQYFQPAKVGADGAPSSSVPNEIPIGSKTVNDYEANIAFIDKWREIFRDVAGENVDFFVESYQPVCGGWFGEGTSTQIQLSIADDYKPTVTIATLDPAKVVCQPTISISSGLALSFIPDQTPAFVPSFKKDALGNPVLDANGNPVIVQSLGYSSQANVRPGYALQTNAALWESRGGFFGIHWAAGAMLTASTGGVTTDIITGPAFSFRRRTFYISPVYDLGLRTQYLSQFGLGTPQGNLTSPPTHQVWKSGFGLTITFPFNSTTTQQESSKAAGTQPAPKADTKKSNK